MPEQNKSKIAQWWYKINVRHSIGLSLILLVVTTILYFVLQKNIFSSGTVSRLLNSNFRTWLPVILVTVGQAIVILGGGLDLSNGAIVSVGNVILALTVTTPDEPGKNLLMVGVVIAFGLVAGLLNGFFTAYLGLQPVIITFASSFVYSGLALLLLPSPGGAIPREYTDVYRNTKLLGIPLSLIIVVVTVLIWAFFRRRKYGRFLFAVGGNDKAAYTTGVPVTWMKISTYMISGLMAALAAISYSLLTGSGLSSSGDEMTLASITAAVLGGISMSGGAGSVVGAVFGGIILGNIRNIISSIKLDSWWRTLVNASLIVLVLAGPGLINLIRGKKK
ncbi:MAG: ABC transporter permease [Anaerolineaceae bacterium]|nr:ABC transporter permease [Anaerolineaceae bacterium]